MKARAVFLIVASAVCLNAPRAHDLITAQTAERFLREIDDNVKIARSKEPPARRAAAQLALGRTLDEVGELLNRDIAAHGKPQGLPTLYLIQALETRGIAPRASPISSRVTPNLAYYREAMGLDPDGSVGAEAAFRLLHAYFYDSFEDDPLKPRNQSWAQLQEQIELGESLLRRAPPSIDREEAEFILAVHYLQAATSGLDERSRARFGVKAREYLAVFRGRYPESMRLPALEMLTERVQTARSR
ncbi:MAG TPA: hypothetical protein VFA81_00065 [Burkholderiales bacterium]|nr:hypothetical protein [Burkholderiales bacterium]